MHDPIITDTGTGVAGLRLGDRRAHALLQAVLVFRLLPNGFANRDLRALLAGLLGADAITAGQMSYDLRRLWAHGLITRIPHSHRYRLTETRRVRASAAAHDIPVIDCKRGERKHEIAEEYLATHRVDPGCS